MVSSLVQSVTWLHIFVFSGFDELLNLTLGRTLQYKVHWLSPRKDMACLFITPIGFEHDQHFSCHLKLRRCVKIVICLHQKIYYSKELNSRCIFWQFHLEAISLLFRTFQYLGCRNYHRNIKKCILIQCLNMSKYR